MVPCKSNKEVAWDFFQIPSNISYWKAFYHTDRQLSNFVVVNSRPRSEIATCGEPRDTMRERPSLDHWPNASAIQSQVKRSIARVQPRLVGPDFTSDQAPKRLGPIGLVGPDITSDQAPKSSGPIGLVGLDITSRTTDEPDSLLALEVSGRLLQHSSAAGFSRTIGSDLYCVDWTDISD